MALHRLATKGLPLGALALAVTLTADAQPGGWVEYDLSALGAGAQNMGAVGEGRLPSRPTESGVSQGTLHVRGSGSRGSLRAVDLRIDGAAPGATASCGSGASVTLTFASGSEVAAADGRCEVTVESVDPQRARGTYSATLVHGRVSMSVRGRFDVRLGGR